ncbi:MAG: hypothetical protein Q9M22_05140 [Mariprofundaceae bacterium]|nr:hypothetical protein [Mariprofundaceae bacterium]
MPVRVVSIDGYTMPANPHASFAPADININKVGASVVNLEAHGVPLGTIIKVSLHPESGAAIVANSTALSGTLAASTATASINIPHGFSRFYITATWVP